MEYALNLQKTKSTINNQSEDQSESLTSLSELAKALVSTPQAKAMLKQSGAKWRPYWQDGLIAQMLQPLMQEMLEAEMYEHLGYPKHHPSGYLSGNSRNGRYQRILRSSDGPFTLDMPKRPQRRL